MNANLGFAGTAEIEIFLSAVSLGGDVLRCFHVLRLPVKDHLHKNEDYATPNRGQSVNGQVSLGGVGMKKPPAMLTALVVKWQKVRLVKRIVAFACTERI